MSRPEADSLKRLSTKDLKRLGLLNNNTPTLSTVLSFGDDSKVNSFYWYSGGELEKILISYIMKDYATDKSTTVDVCTMPCFYGGKKWLFKCPSCNRLCYKIYLYSTDFKCRQCHNLTYESNNKNKNWRALDTYFNLAFYEDNKAYKKAKRYPTYKGRYTRNYNKTISKYQNIDIYSLNAKLDKWLDVTNKHTTSRNPKS